MIGNSVEMANYSSGYRGKKFCGHDKSTTYDAKYRGKKANIVLDDERPCSYCDSPGHSRDNCFKLVGYPEWYYELKKKKKSHKPHNAAKVCSYDESDDEDQFVRQQAVHRKREVEEKRGNAPKGKGKSIMESPIDDNSEFSGFAGSAGFDHYCYDECKDQSTKYLGEHYSFTSLSQVEWIIESGASTHMASSLNMFSKRNSIAHKQIVILPDGSMKRVKTVGNVPISKNLILHNVLYLPHFKYNLLSISALLKEGIFKVVFYAYYCNLQDKRT